MSTRDSSDPSRSAEGSNAAGLPGDQLAQRLIRHAARSAPAPLSERLEEEWLADLATRRGPVSRLLFGLGCCWATRTIVREHCALRVSAATASAGNTTITAHAHPELKFLPRRTAVLVTIIGLHVAIIYAFATGLGHRLLKDLQTPLVADFLPAVRTRETPPPPPPVDLLPPRKIDLGPPPIVDLGADPSPGALQTEPPAPAPETPTGQSAPAPAPVKRVAGGPGKGFPDSEDFYPPAARRLGEQGNTAVLVCVDPSGRLTAEPRVARSSGSARLDDGALKLARAGSGHYRATTENGLPVSSCYEYLIRFTLN